VTGRGVHEGSYVGIHLAPTDLVRRRELRTELNEYLRRLESDEREER
jgi:hypothetical protein